MSNSTMQAAALKNHGFSHEYFPSPYLFFPYMGRLMPYHVIDKGTGLYQRSQDVEKEISRLLSKKYYPCVGALRSFRYNEYQVGLYCNFGSGVRSKDLRNDLLYFLEQQHLSQSNYLSFWAIFDDTRPFSGEEFEKRLWDELSMLTSENLKKIDWPDDAQSNPMRKSFSFCIGGQELFVVGLHSMSPRLSRRFPWPALVFNSFEQFNRLKNAKKFFSMVKANRELDQKFQGSANPMAEQYGEKWESIQFSGNENPPDWECPFRFLKNPIIEN